LQECTLAALFASVTVLLHGAKSWLLGVTIPVHLVYDYVEIRADELHVYHDIYARIGNKWAHILQTLAAHGYTADSIDQTAIQQRLKAAKFRDVVIALTEIRRQPSPDG
jgi:hypothetical protein